MKLVARSTPALAVFFCAISVCLGEARAGLASITFDEPQLVDNDPLLQFYNGGTTFRGIGGGPNLGVSFTINARVRTVDSLVGDYTKPGFMELMSDVIREGAGISATMDVSGGFTTGVQFSYASIDSVGDMKVYSGLDGTGTVLADLSLPITSPMTGPGVFVADSLTFSGVGYSIVFTGGNKQLAFDDLTTTFLVPEPSGWSLLAIGAVLCGLVRRLRRSE
jgi:PEP-CTERM motif